MAFFEKFKKLLNPEKKQKEIYSSLEEPVVITQEERKAWVSLLTPREHDLYLLLLEGFTLKEGAEQLSIKYSTANTHISGIYKKLKVNSRAELIINYLDLEKN